MAMMEYWVITLRGPDDLCTNDLNFLARDGWRLVAPLDSDGWPRVIMARERPASETAPP